VSVSAADIENSEMDSTVTYSTVRTVQYSEIAISPKTYSTGIENRNAPYLAAEKNVPGAAIDLPISILF
jgi:hypothetical protein